MVIIACIRAVSSFFCNRAQPQSLCTQKTLPATHTRQAQVPGNSRISIVTPQPSAITIVFRHAGCLATHKMPGQRSAVIPLFCAYTPETHFICIVLKQTVGVNRYLNFQGPLISRALREDNLGIIFCKKEIKTWNRPETTTVVPVFMFAQRNPFR